MTPASDTSESGAPRAPDLAVSTTIIEHRRQPLLPRREFLRRLGRFAAAAVAVVMGGLGIGILGYHEIEGLSWIDSFLNAAMILGGMGPVSPIRSAGGKLFAGCYALFSGFVLLLVAGLILTPLLHRLLHRFHLEDEPGRER